MLNSESINLSASSKNLGVVFDSSLFSKKNNTYPIYAGHASIISCVGEICPYSSCQINCSGQWLLELTYSFSRNAQNIYGPQIQKQSYEKLKMGQELSLEWAKPCETLCLHPYEIPIQF